MGKRGPVSGAALSIASPSSLETIPRPDAPYDLTDEQSEEWWAVVNRLPADWFPRETHAMLASYCRHVVTARRVANLIVEAESAPQLDMENYDQLLRMQEREGRALSSLATRMRISQQASYDKEKKKKLTLVRKPWES